ncbi:MAG: Crp/Fnr family transcriptional regulator [Chryseobacterium sp.]|nr:Crp/Fnr family transcriptional regulator [Chryseobacterium sp.]
MIINELILESIGATTEHYLAGESIFAEDDLPKYYYQINEGKVKLNNYNNEGREVLQTILEPGQSIGESLLFVDDVTYPVNAIAITPCKIFKLRRSAFFALLDKNPDVSLEMNRYLSQILYFKQIMSTILCTNSPMFKIRALLDYLKSKQEEKGAFAFQVPFTRQEMANLTGLCVETTIRTIKTMEKDNIVRIRDRKILY